MSDSNRSALLYARETAYKTSQPALPAQDVTGTNTLFNLRFTKESLEATKDTVKSEEIRSDRMVSAIVEVGLRATGGTDHEVIAQDFDDLMGAALMADNLTSATAVCAISSSAQTITASTGTPFAALALANPKFLLVAGAVNATNNGQKLVISITSTVITLAAGSLTNAEASPSLTISGNFIAALDNVVVTITQSGADTVYTATSGTYSAATQGARYVLIAACVSANNNGIRKVVSCTSTVLTVVTGPLGFNSETGSSIEIFCNYIRTGTTYLTHVLEKQFLDIPHYMPFIGMGVDSMEIKIEAKKISTLAFTFLGYKGEESANTIVGTTVASSTNLPVNAASNIGSLTKDGNAMLNPVKSLTFKVMNNLRERPVIGDLGSAAHGQGRSEISGQMEVYFSNKELLREFLNHTQMALEVPIVDLGGNTTNFYFPAVQSTKGTPNATAVNTDVMQTVAFECLKSATTGYQLQIDRLA